MRRIVRAFFTCSLLQSGPRHPLRANHQRRAALLLLWLVLFGPPLNDSIAGGPAAPSKGQTTPITLRFVSWKPDHPRVWDDALDEFTKAHPHISIVRELAPHSSTAYHDLLTQKLKNRDATVDVFFMDVIWVPEFAEAGWARRLDERFTPAMREEFLPATIEVGRYSDHLYGVPSRIDAGLLYYRSDLLAKYGFSPPTTWDELARQADAIVAGERRNNPTLRGYTAQFKQYEGLVCNLLEFIDGHGGSLLTSDGTHSTLGRPETLAAVQFVRDRVIGRLASRAALTYQEPESLSVFLQGHAVFHRNWPYAWELANNRTRSTIAGQVAVMPLPRVHSGAHGRSTRRLALRHQRLLAASRRGLGAHRVSLQPGHAKEIHPGGRHRALPSGAVFRSRPAGSSAATPKPPDCAAGRHAAPAVSDLSRLVASAAALFQPCPCHRRPRPCAGSGRDRRPHRSATRPHEGCAMIRAASILRNRDSLAAWTMVAPALLVTMVFALYPVLDSLWLSLHNIFIGLPQLGSPFVGFDNYLMLVRDPVAQQALAVTLAFVILSTLLELACGLIIALVIHERFRGRGLVRAAILIPWAIPTVVASQLWRYIFNDQYGFANLLLFGEQVTDYIPWLAYPGVAFGIVVLADVWKTSSFAALLILAGLQVIPDDLYDAARVDGATVWQRFWHITLPLLKPALLLALLFRTMDAFRVFDLVFVMTQGGPGDATQVLQFYGYQTLFTEGRIGYGSAVSVAVFLMILALSLTYLRAIGSSLLERRRT